jgi:hypothetical protein
VPATPSYTEGFEDHDSRGEKKRKKENVCETPLVEKRQVWWHKPVIPVMAGGS